MTKKLVNIWIEFPHKRLRNKNTCVIRDINKLISSCVTSTPSDFQRKRRTLDFISVCKATEYRLFLLYLDPVILQQSLPQPLYHNFRRLALSIYLLAHPRLRNSTTNSVRMGLLNILKKYEWCYEPKILVYNVYLLQHLPDDVRAHGPLDCFSAFPFESYMRQIKRSMHSAYVVAKQAAQRYVEISFCDRL